MNEPPIPVCTLFKEDSSTATTAVVESNDLFADVPSNVGGGGEAPVCNLFQSSDNTTSDLFSTLSLAENNLELVSDKDEEDPFTSALHSSEIARRREAWIPCSADTRAALDNPVGGKQLTKPGLSTSESLGNPLAELLAKVLPGNEINMTCCLSPDSVSKDEAGLKKLISGGNFRAAVDLTAAVLSSLGQGFGQSTRDSENTPGTLQWWNARLTLLMHLKLYNIVETELTQFGDLDSPDLYFSYYPGLYTGRRGCMVPFSLRLLHATFPAQKNQPAEAISRLNSMHHVCQMIIENLESSKTEDGLVAELKTEDRNASLDLWKSRYVSL